MSVSGAGSSGAGSGGVGEVGGLEASRQRDGWGRTEMRESEISRFREFDERFESGGGGRGDVSWQRDGEYTGE